MPYEASVRVWGDRACYTQPALHTERFTYPIITPSAARGVLEAILWKPQFVWVITAVDVVRPGRPISLRRNEVTSRQTKAPPAEGEWDYRFFADETSTNGNRTQRAAGILADVEYVIHGEIHPRPGESINKYTEMFERRLSKGQCAWQPYLGCREFTCFFEPADEYERCAWTEDLGWILLDIDYANGSKSAEFFQARVDEGRMTIPHPPRWAIERGAHAS